MLALVSFAGQGLVADVAPPAGSSRVYIQMAPHEKATVINNIVGNGGTVHHEFDSLGAVAATLPDQAIAGLSRNPAVLLVEEDPLRFLFADTVTDGLIAVQADAAWLVQDGTGFVDGAGVVVGVIDSGIYTAHEDFQGAPGVSIDGFPKTATTTIRGGGKPTSTTVTLTEDDEAYWARDRLGHGTHVSGTIAAAANGLGVVGVSPGKASIYMVKVFGDTGNWVYSSSLLSAVQEAVSGGGAQVINMSLGGPTASSTEESGMAQLESQGVVLVAAAGNDGNSSYSYPASYNSVISVAAVSVDNGTYTVANFSQFNDQVEIAAPGVSVLSTVPFIDNSSVSVGGQTWLGNGIENSATSSGVQGLLVDGGLGDTPSSTWLGKVVLVERGAISFDQKVQNVESEGGLAAVIYNNVDGELFATLGAGNSSLIPAIGITQADGQALIAGGYLGQSATVSSEFLVPGNGYEAWDGTSMASPHVAGAVALLLDAYPDATPQNIRDALAASADDFNGGGRDNEAGHGLLQITDALTELGIIMAAGGGGGGTGGGGGDELTISGLTSTITNAKNGRFEITWTTSIPADGKVVIGTSEFTNSELTTSHKFGFRGQKGATYSYTVYSSANGLTATDSGTHNN